MLVLKGIMLACTANADGRMAIQDVMFAQSLVHGGGEYGSMRKLSVARSTGALSMGVR